MKWFTDLAVLGKSDALGKLIATIESRLSPNWRRDLEAENRAARHTDIRLHFIRWRRPSDEIVFALAEYPEVICVDNVFAYPGRNLPSPEYSELLEDFFWRIVKPAADQLGLKYFSSGFEDKYLQWAKRRSRGRSAMEIALGFGVVWRLRTEGYMSRFPVRYDTIEEPTDGQSIARRLPRGLPVMPELR